MNVKRILFSPTGGTKRVADAITDQMSSVDTIDLTKPDQAFEEVQIAPDDAVIIAMPSYGGLAPQVALERLSRIHGNGAKCAIVCVYGNRAYEDTLVQMEDTATACGFHVIAGISAVAEHSIMHQYASGRPDSADQAKLAEFATKIEAKFSSGEDTKPEMPGNRSYRKASGAGLVPKAGGACTSCGTCAKLCPVQAIDPQKPRVTDGKKCISCMRCVSVCPQHARHVNGFMVSVAALTIKKACQVAKQPELFI